MTIFNGIDRKALAEELGTTVNVINQIACGARKPSPWRALQIEKITDGKIKASDLRPDIFQTG